MDESNAHFIFLKMFYDQNNVFDTKNDYLDVVYLKLFTAFIGLWLLFIIFRQRIKKITSYLRNYILRLKDVNISRMVLEQIIYENNKEKEIMPQQNNHNTTSASLYSNPENKIKINDKESVYQNINCDAF
ncbi:hypothetical protein HZS_8007, partial [Henneguya salminicola]